MRTSDTIRVTQLTLLVFKEILHLDRTARSSGDKRGRIELDASNARSKGSFESFSDRNNFAQERKHEAVRKMLGRSRQVRSGRVRQHTKGNVLTMQELKASSFPLARPLQARARRGAASGTMLRRRRIQMAPRDLSMDQQLSREKPKRRA